LFWALRCALNPGRLEGWFGGKGFGVSGFGLFGLVGGVKRPEGRVWDFSECSCDILGLKFEFYLEEI
jgi:hypothetical protein